MHKVKKSHSISIMFFIIFIVFNTLVSCEKEKPEPKLPAIDKTEISGKRLWKRITEETNYKYYSFWPGHKGIQPGQAPHGVFHKVYINRTLKDALPIKIKIAPYGSIIVKENFNSEKNPTSITVIAKVKDYNPEYGDWFWAAYDPKGKVLKEGKIDSCISCHEGKRDNDYIIIKPLDKMPAKN